MPGVQNPHWEPPQATNASAHARATSVGSPSTVSTLRPETRRTGVTHDTRA